jgi:4-carboxymuconolactone decarboxylase
MSYREERRGLGDQTIEALFGTARRQSRELTPLRNAKRDFAFGEVWIRPGLQPWERWLIALTCVGHSGNVGVIDAHVHGAMASGALTLTQMREFTLQFAVYCGWFKAEVVDDAVSRAADALGIAEPPQPPPLPLDPGERQARGAACFESVMTFAAPCPPQTCYASVGILNFVFGEMWDRPGLDRKSRRIVTLASVGMNDARGPIASHIYATLNSGQLSVDEMREFVLQFAVYAGWPKASEMESMIGKVAERVADGRLPYDLF